MSIGLYIVLAPLYLKSVRKLQEKRFVFVKILAIIIPENGAKVSKIKCFQFAQQTLYMYIDELKDINIKAWMYTTAKHMALNYNKKAEREVLSETGDDPVILDLEDSAEDTYMERMRMMNRPVCMKRFLQPCTSIIHVGMMQFVMYITWRFRSLLLQKEWR